MDDICRVCGCLGYVPPTDKGATGFFCPECHEALETAKRFHEEYERLAPNFDYKTRRSSAKPWEEVPENNRRLMVATCRVVLRMVHDEEDRLREVLGLVRDHLERNAVKCPECRRAYAYVEEELRDSRKYPPTQADQIRALATETDNLSAPLFGWTKRREVTKRLRQFADLLDRLGKPCYIDPDDPQPCREGDPSRGACQVLEEGGSWVACEWGGQYEPPEQPEEDESAEEVERGETDADGGSGVHDPSGGAAG